MVLMYVRLGAADDQQKIIERAQPALWVHRHAHDSFDYTIGSSRILCNSRGYVRREPNPNFDPGLIVEL